MTPHTPPSRLATHLSVAESAPKRSCRSLKKSPLFVISLLLAFGGRSALRAQETGYPGSDSEQDVYNGQSYSPGEQAPPAIQPLGAERLEQLVAPIALYPDALVAQILAASTYPQQVANADAWRQQRAYASQGQIAAEAEQQAWDPSVKALTAFPQVLAQMDRNLQWTTDLGNAYYNQQEDVLEAVQVMRRHAQAAGNLQSSPQEVVRYNDGYIQLAPADPQVVYVPTYNPWTIYGEAVSPYPGFNLLGILGDFFGASPLQYGLGIAMAAFTHTPFGWLAWGLDWLAHALLFNHSDYSSHSNTVDDWGFRNSGFHAYAGRGGFGRSGVRSAGWGHAGYAGGQWHSFARGNMRADSRNGEWHSFTGSNAGPENWRGRSSGSQSFHGDRTMVSSYGRDMGNRDFNNRRGRRTEYGSNFSHAPARNFQESRFEGRSQGGSYGSNFAPNSRPNYGSSYRSPHVAETRAARSGGLHLFGGGHSQKGFGSRNWGGPHSGGGGHAPKNFGGGHSHSGGHSGGHGGGSKHRR